MIPSAIFKVGEHWSYLGQHLRFECEMGNGCLFFREQRTLGPFQIEDADGNLCAPDIAWALRALAAGDLKGECDPSNPPDRRRVALQDIDPETARRDPDAEMRLFVLKALDALPELPRSDGAFRVALSRIWAGRPEIIARFRKKPAPCTVRRWIDQRGMSGDRRLHQMVSMSGKTERKKRLSPDVRAEIHNAALWYWSARRWSISDALGKLRSALDALNEQRAAFQLAPLGMPSREKLRLVIRSLECAETVREKFGAKAADTLFKPCGPGLSAIRILQLGAMDHTQLDGVVIIDAGYMLPLGRPYLTALLDIHSDCIVGFFVSFEPPSTYSVMECIKRANRPKIDQPAAADKYPILPFIFGRFDEIIADNAMEFSGLAMQDSLTDAGPSLRLPPVGAPTWKASIERFFDTLNNLLNKKLPGGTLKPDLMRELGYDPRQDAVLTLAELEGLIWEALVLYHITPKEGQPFPPAQIWEVSAKEHGIAFFKDDSQLEKMLGKVQDRCRVTRSGVEIFGLTYCDGPRVASLLEDLFPQESVRARRKGSATALVKVKYNPANISEIHVWNRIRSRYVTLPCVDEKYTQGVSLWHHRKIQDWAKQRGLEFSSEADRLRARASLIKTLEEIAPTLRGKELRAFARLSTSPKIQAKVSADVALAYALGRHDGMGPLLVPHDTLAAERTDEGRPSSRPPRKKKPTPKPKRRKEVHQGSPPKPETGQLADFSVDLSSWKEVEL